MIDNNTVISRELIFSLVFYLGDHMGWIDLGWLPDAHPAALSLPLLNRPGRENTLKKLLKMDKEINALSCRPGKVGRKEFTGSFLLEPVSGSRVILKILDSFFFWVNLQFWG